MKNPGFRGALAIVLLFVLVASGVSLALDKSLRFNANGKFKIVHFTDMHFGETDVEDFETQNVQRAILAAENPDIVVLGGDHVSGYSYPGGNGWYASKYQRAVQVLQEMKFKWAMALGNHDVEADLDRRQITEVDMSYEYSLTRMGPSELHGVTNYVLDIAGSVGNQTIARLYFFDSLRDHCLGVRGWGCVMHSQIDWYRKWISNVALDNSIAPAIAFIHIPLPEMLQLWNYRTTFGYQKEKDGICCSSVNTGLFGAFREYGEVKALISGHDHMNDFIGEYEGILMGYGRKTGYGGYFQRGLAHGARVIEITERPFSIKTWIRDEHGELDDQRSVRNDPGFWRHKITACCNSYQQSFWDRYLGDNSTFHFVWVTLPVVIIAIAATWRLAGRSSSGMPTGGGFLRFCFNSRNWMTQVTSRLLGMSRQPFSGPDKFEKYTV